jgi:diguanylate cyclase (GGDEF)-like protein
VITDIKMPRKTGLDVIRGVSGNTDEVDVIILTGYSDETTAIECLRYGAYDYLHKPLEDMDVLLKAVERALQKRRLYLENQQLLQKLADLSIKDPLTQLYNYRFLGQRLTEELLRARRYRRPLTLLMLDLDHFKQINDTHGHPFGDYVLKEMARLLTISIRDADTAFRYGGEEFCVLMPETPPDGARQVIDRLLNNVRDTRFVDNGCSTQMTVSIGAASFPENAADKSQLIAAADQALYEAKRAGRGQACWSKAQTDGDAPLPERKR